METEIWKEIKGYEGLFAVSNLGRVKSLARRVSNHTGFINKPERIMKHQFNRKGYPIVRLQDVDKYKKTFSIHRLVAKSFIPNPENKPQVNHIDGNKQNNRVENLEWCTNGENQIHAYANGLNHRVENAGRAKRKVNQIDITTGKIIRTFNSISAASMAMCNKTTSNIGGCCRHKYGMKTSFGYKWEFANE